MANAVKAKTNGKREIPTRKRRSPKPLLQEDLPAAWVEVRTLLPWIKNPRKNDNAVQAAMRSIKRFGWGAPVVARKANGEIIAGHTRIKAALQLGIERVPVRYLDLSEKEAHAYAIADNKVGELALWDEPLLLDVMCEELQVHDVDGLLDLGFAEKEANKYLALLENNTDAGGRGEEDEVPTPPKNPITKVGDIWQLSEHRLLCGDCRVAADVEKLFGDRQATVAFTSPPYASQRKYDETSAFKPIHPDEFVEWFYAVQANVQSVLAKDGSWFVNIKEHCDDGQRSLYVKDLVIAHVRQWGWYFIDELCWRNTKNGVPGGWNNRFKNAFEPVFHFARGGEIKFRPEHVSTPSEHLFEATDRVSSTGSGLLGARDGHFNGFARPSNVVECAASSERLHSAAFPVALPEFFVKAYTDAGDLVFDPFMGSGTTIVACDKTKRIGYGIEISPAYCDVIVERWEKFTGQKAKRVAP